MRTARFLSACVALLTLSSCQPPTFEIIANGTTRQMIFTARGSGIWPFRNEENLDSAEITVRDRDRITWAIRRIDRTVCNWRETSTPPFPLTYGKLPRCFEQVVEPLPLRAGPLYRIESQGFRRGTGLFRILEVTKTLEWDEVSAELLAWPDRSIPPPPAEEAR